VRGIAGNPGTSGPIGSKGHQGQKGEIGAEVITKIVYIIMRKSYMYNIVKKYGKSLYCMEKEL
jgi:hypothetical protein